MLSKSAQFASVIAKVIEAIFDDIILVTLEFSCSSNKINASSSRFYVHNSLENVPGPI